MTQPLAASTQAVVGQPATVRIGVVTATSPLTLQVQGRTFQGTAVGVLNSYIPAIGDNVCVVGQSTTSGSDPKTWMILGSLRASATEPAVSVYAYNSGGTTSVSAVYAPAVPQVGVVFVAPSSAKVQVSWGAGLDNTAADTKGVMGWEIREGAVIGAGTVVIPATDNLVIGLRGTDEIECGRTSTVLAGTLTPGLVYNAQLMFARQAGTGTAAYARGDIGVHPVS